METKAYAFMQSLENTCYCMSIMFNNTVNI